jgi:hypothetical protein
MKAGFAIAAAGIAVAAGALVKHGDYGGGVLMSLICLIFVGVGIADAIQETRR